MERIWAQVAAAICLSVTGCVALTEAIHFPDRRPAGPKLQTIADRLTAAAGADAVEVTVWGDPDDPQPVENPISVIKGSDEILIHVLLARYFRDEPDALAVMFGHELGHRLAGYGSDPDGEARADAFGVILAARAGFDPWVGAAWECALFRTNDPLPPPDEVHPPADERCGVLMMAAAATGAPLPARKPKTE